MPSLMQEDVPMPNTQALMPVDKRQKRIAKEIRAARAYADLTQDQLGALIGHDGQTVLSWEAGKWKRQPPRPAILADIARACGIPEPWIDTGFLEHTDPAKRVAAAARREAQRQAERRRESPPAHPDEDAGGGGA